MFSNCSACESITACFNNGRCRFAGTYQRGPDGRSIPSSDYPPIPEATHFWTGYGFSKPESVHYWCWRTDYQMWGAYVTFLNGKSVVTNPKVLEAA